MGWTQIAQVVIGIIDRLRGTTAQRHPHQNRQVARPPSMLRMPFTTDQLPGGTSRSRAFQARYRRRLVRRRRAYELGQKAEFEPVIVAAGLPESGLKGILRALVHAPTTLPERQLILTYRSKTKGCFAVCDRTLQRR